MTMSDIFDGTEDAKTAIRAAVQYLLNGVSGTARGEMVRDIVEIVRQVADGPQPDPLDDGLPGG